MGGGVDQLTLLTFVQSSQFFSFFQVTFVKVKFKLTAKYDFYFTTNVFPVQSLDQATGRK